MKNIKKFVLSLLVAVLVVVGGFSLVTKVEAGTAPKITSGVLAVNNAYVDVNFDVGVYGDAGHSTPVNAGSFTLNFIQGSGTATAVVISSVTKTDGNPLVGGETTARINISITGIPNGFEKVEIIPSGPASIYNITGDAMSPLTETTGALMLNGPATIVSTEITSPTQFTIVYSHALNAAFTDYSALFVDGHAAASVDSMIGTDTATHVITFTPNISFPVTVASTGTINIAALSGTVGTGFPGQTDQVLTDGQSPSITSVIWTNVDANTAISGTDTIDVTFNEPINTVTIDNTNVDTQLLNVLTGHSFGTIGAGQNVSWNLAGTVLRITLGTDTTIVSGDTIDPVAGVTDVAGNPDASTPLPILDNVAPVGSVAASASVIKIGSTTQTINVTYSEPMAVTHPTISFNHGTFVTNADGAWSDTTHYHESFVDSSAEEFSAVTVTTSGATDLALNHEGTSIAGANNPFILDTIAPTTPTAIHIVSDNGIYTLAKVGDTVTITASVDGTIVTGSIGGRPTTTNTVTGGFLGATATLTRVLDGTETEGPGLDFTLVSIDAVGNSATAVTKLNILDGSAVQTDFTAPSTITSSLGTGTYSTSQTTSLASTGSTSIRFTVDGSTPTCSSGTVYSGTISINISETIKAIGCDNTGNGTSGSFNYSIYVTGGGGGGGSYSPAPVVSTPVITPVVVPVKIPADCTSSTLFSPTTGEPCKKTGLAPGPTTILQSILDALSLVILNPKEIIGLAPGPTTIVQSVLDSMSISPITQNKTTGAAPGPTTVTGLASSTPSIAPTLLSKVQAINTNIFLGMRGNEQIRSIQQFLIDQNKGPAAKAISTHGLTPNFGALTKTALIEWQKAVGITPATGVFGPATRAKMQELGM